LRHDHFLQVDILGGQSIGEIINDLESGAGDYDRKGDRSKARDTTFNTAGGFDSTKFFNAVLYLVSHAATFKWRTRSVVRAAYEERFVVSTKQKAALDKWEKKDPAKLAKTQAT
jgi:hypothetical protein